MNGINDSSVLKWELNATRVLCSLFQKNDVSSSLLIMDNFSAHSRNERTEQLGENSINYPYRDPNTTPMTQSVDFQIRRSLKGNIRKIFEDWLIENEDQVIYYDVKKKNTSINCYLEIS